MQSDIAPIIIRNKLFLGLDFSNFPFASISADRVSINEGKMLFKKGEPAEFIYLLQSGEINYFIDDDSGITQIMILQECDFIVQPDLSKTDHYMSSAIAMRDSLLIKISRQDILDLIEAYPVIQSNIEQKFIEKTHFSFEQPPMGFAEEEKKESKPEETENVDSVANITETEVGEIEIDFSNVEEVPTPFFKKEESVKEKLIFNSDDIFNQINGNEHFNTIDFSDVKIIVVNIKDATMKFAPEIKSLLLSLIESGSKKIVVELNYCDMIDSTFLGALVLSLKKMNISKGELRLVCGNKPAWMIFEMTGMAKVFNTFANLDDAMEGFFQD